MDTERATHLLAGLTPSERARARELVDRVAECDRAIARAEGDKSAALAELATIAHAQGERSDNPEGVEYARRAMAGEVAAATRTHPTAAKHQLGDAEQFVEQYAETHRALCEGRISARHARVITDAGGLVDLQDRGALDRGVVDFAEQHTAGELAKIVKRQAAEIAASSPRERHQFARRRRFMSLTERDDGMSDLLIHLPTFEARGIMDRTTQLVKIVKAERRRARRRFARGHGHAATEQCTPDCARGSDADGAAPCRGAARSAAAGSAAGTEPDRTSRSSAAPDTAAGQRPDSASHEYIVATDTRTTDQLRVDILTDLLLSAAPTGHELHSAGTGSALENVRATVQVTIPVEQIIDPDAGTSWIDDGGLVSSDSARAVAGRTAGWERLFYRPDTGVIERTDHYRPTAAQRRALIGRDITCRFPGCTTPARRSDIDHTHDYALGGSTELSNLAHLCEAHHMMKHQSEWSVRQLPHGVIEWTSPTGRTHRDSPVSRVFFQATDRAPDKAPDDDPPWKTDSSTTAPGTTTVPASGNKTTTGTTTAAASGTAPDAVRDGNPYDPENGFRRHIDDLERRRTRRANAEREEQIVRDRDRRAQDDRNARATERRDDREDRNATDACAGGRRTTEPRDHRDDQTARTGERHTDRVERETADNRRETADSRHDRDQDAA